MRECLWVPGAALRFLFQVLREGRVFTNPDDDANGTGNATDGDLDAAYALFLAAREWKEAAYKRRGTEVCSSCPSPVTGACALLWLPGLGSQPAEDGALTASILASPLRALLEPQSCAACKCSSVR